MYETVSDIMRAIASSLQVPVIILLIALTAVTAVLVGWVIAEGITERRHLKVELPSLLDEIREGDEPDDECIRKSGLLKSQKKVLLELTNHPNFTPLMRESLADSLLDKEEHRYKGILKITDTLAKIAPMLGLMGTLIPLGPGIIGLGQGDTITLSNSLLTAFDTTILGLLCAAVCLVISVVRKGWYTQYMSILETVADCVLEEEKLEHPGAEAEPIPRSEPMWGSVSR